LEEFATLATRSPDAAAVTEIKQRNATVERSPLGLRIAEMSSGRNPSVLNELRSPLLDQRCKTHEA
jgi:hypothetical protein